MMMDMARSHDGLPLGLVNQRFADEVSAPSSEHDVKALLKYPSPAPWALLHPFLQGCWVRVWLEFLEAWIVSPKGIILAMRGIPVEVNLRHWFEQPFAVFQVCVVFGVELTDSEGRLGEHVAVNVGAAHFG